MKQEDTSQREMPLEERFGFGENWSNYIQLLDEDRIARARETLLEMTGLGDFNDQTFLDIGCGSGLFSLAARQLGAKVTSIDFDPNSVDCARRLKNKFYPDDPAWTIQQGSVLDIENMEGLGVFNIVYSWGVLHHTGRMWEAISNASNCVAPGGIFFIAIYNDQGRISRQWLAVKKRYNEGSGGVKKLMIYWFIVQFWWKTVLRDLLKYGNPLYTWRNYRSERGMDVYHDMVDWIGGYPFEVAKPEEILHFCVGRGFRLVRMKTCGGGLGCNEFVFKNE